MTIDPVAAAIAAAKAAANPTVAQAPQPSVPPFAVPEGFTAVQDQAGQWMLVALQPVAAPVQAEVLAPEVIVQPTAYVPPQAAPTPAYAAPVVHTQNTAVAVASSRPAGVRVSIRELVEEKGSMSLDMFLSVDENGIKVKIPDGDPRAIFANNLVSSIKGTVDFAEIQPVYSIRYTKGANTVYHRSLDRVVDDQGTRWDIRLAEAKQAEPAHKGDYPSVNFVFTVTEDVVSLQGNTVLQAGERVGFSTSVTNWAAFVSFFNKCIASGEVTEDEDGSASGKVPFQLGFLPKSGGKNTWGVFTFTREEDVVPVGAATTKKK